MVSNSNSTNRYRIEAVDRALTLLITLASSQGVSASELSLALGANRSLVFRMLSTLADRGFVFKDAGNLYWLGPQLLYLGGQTSSRNSLIYASSEVMDNMLNDTQESVGLVTRDKSEVIRVAFRESSQLLRLPAPFAARGSLHEGGGAKLLLAYSPDDIIDEVIAKHLDAFVPATLRTREAVLKLLENIRRDGYYLAIGELHPDVFTITAPVRDADGRVVAAIGVMGPTSRINPERTDRLIKCVVEGAEQISRRLG